MGSYGGDLICFTTDKRMNYPCEIIVVDSRKFEAEEPVMKIQIPSNGPKITSMLWSSLDNCLLTGHENGDLVQWDMRTQKQLKRSELHQKDIVDMQSNKDGTMFVTASKDHSALLWDTDTLEHLKTYKTERPVNSASISPLFEHVV